MCPFKTPPCVRSKRPRVYRHHAHMCFTQTNFHVPDSSNRLPCLIKLFSVSNLEGNFGSNQQPDGSTCLSPSPSPSPPPSPSTTTPRTLHDHNDTQNTTHSITHNITRRLGQRERAGERERSETEKEDRERGERERERSPSQACFTIALKSWYKEKDIHTCTHTYTCTYTFTCQCHVFAHFS